jgi:hypothetical protein
VFEAVPDDYVERHWWNRITSTVWGTSGHHDCGRHRIRTLERPPGPVHSGRMRFDALGHG